VKMGIDSRRCRIRLTATPMGHWRVTVAPFRENGKGAVAIRGGEPVWEFLTREAVADADGNCLDRKRPKGAWRAARVAWMRTAGRADRSAERQCRGRPREEG
jgi:hypothetical protein